MRRNKTKKTKLVAILLILVLLISIGYAALTTNLQINGNATIKAQSWNVYFDNVQTTTGSVTANPAPTTSGTTTTSLTWTVSMDTPGQFYEFYVDVVNGGSIDAMIGSLSNTTLTSAQADYLNYTVTYDDGSPIEQYDTLAANTSDKLKIRLEFRTDIDPEDLPGTAQQITLTYTSNYVQADTHAKARTVATLTSTQLAQAGTIKVGDYVNYTPSSGSVTITAAQSGASDSQTFSTADDSGMIWRVLSVNSTTGEIKIVASPTSNSLELNGRAGFGNAETVLNSVASIYGGGTGAASVRSITEDDIFDSIGYNKTTNYVGDTNTYTSGEWFTENWDSTSGTATYSTTTTTATAENPVTLHNTSHNQYDSNNNWVGGGINVASQTLENGTAAQKAEMQIYWDMLIGGDYEDVANYDTTGCFDYWCASRLVYCNSDNAYFCVRSVYDGGVSSGYGGDDDLFGSSTSGSTGEYSCSRAVVPVVTLQSNIGMEQDNNNVWNFVQ